MLRCLYNWASNAGAATSPPSPSCTPHAETGRVTTVFVIGDNHRTLDTETGERRDEEPVFWHVLVFGQLAETSRAPWGGPGKVVK